MRNLKVKPFAFIIFVFFAISFVGISLLTGREVTDVISALAVAYKTIPVILGLWGLFVWKGWKIKRLSGWLVPFPDLNGTWEGTLQTTWEDVPGAIPVILTVKQSFTRISCVMRSGEMTSRSHFADFWIDSDEQLRNLGYSYSSVPSPLIIDRSPAHDGTVTFEIIGDPVTKLKGTYWNSRKSTGEITLTFKTKEMLDEYPEELGEHPMKAKRVTDLMKKEVAG
jgi:hypothetical protein